MTLEVSEVQDHPAFIRLEAKVDGLLSEIRDYKSLVDKSYVTRTEFEVERSKTSEKINILEARVLPNNKLVSDIVKYIIFAGLGAVIAVVFKG